MRRFTLEDYADFLLTTPEGHRELFPMKRQRAASFTGPQKKRKLVVATVAPPKLNPIQRAQVKRIVSSKEEKKFLRPGIAADPIPITSQITSLLNINQGDGNSERVGNVIEYKYVRLRATITMTDATNIVRIVLFKWNDNDAFNPPTDVQLMSLGPSGVVEPLSFPNDETKQSYTIIYDKTFVGSNGTSNPKLIQFVDVKIPLQGKAHFYGDAVTTGTHKLYRHMQSDSAAASHPSVTWQAEVCYTDA